MQQWGPQMHVARYAAVGGCVKLDRVAVAGAHGSKLGPANA